MDENLSYDELLKQAFTEDEDSAGENNPDLPTESEQSEVQEEAGAENAVSDPEAEAKEKNRRQAFGRRTREAEGKYNALSKEVDDYFKKQGFKSFADAKEAQNKAALEKEIGNLGFNGNDIAPSVEAIVNNMPTMQAARELAQKAERERQEHAFQRELELIGKMDPSIQSAEDLLSSENREAMDKLVFENGLSLSEAFRLANFDKLVSAKEDAASKKTFNSVAGKQHLTRTSSAGGETIKVPDDVYSMYRALNPDASDAEIRKHYAKSLK